MAVKTTLYLDSELAERVRRFVPAGRFNRFVVELLSQKVDELERLQLEEELRDGYIATRAERAELNGDWQVTDVEDWPE